MIASLTGSVHKLKPEEVIVTVNGVGYRVFVPINIWDGLSQDTETTLSISTYVREDRLALFGFANEPARMLFERFVAMSGIGPKHALELSAVPKSLLMQAIGSQEPALLTSIKGIGKKTAEKLLLDLKSLAEKEPEIFGAGSSELGAGAVVADQDVIEALKTLGYDTQTIMKTLHDLPKELETSEQRVAAALRLL